MYSQLHCGYYECNGKIFITRQDMFDDMYTNKQYGKISYNFNDHVFKKLDWSIEPTQSLKELYVQRCQQLRDTYDYLILSYSGGADSHEILYTCLENNIFIDEIQIIHYEKALLNFNRADLMNDVAVSQLLEYEMVVVPQLKIIKEKSPNTKISLLDASDFIVDDITSNSYNFMGMGKYHTNATFVTQTTPYARNFFQIHYNNKYLNKTNKTGFIRGCEKPQLGINKNGDLFFAFTDVSMNGVRLIQKKDVDEMFTFENFFWSPDAPFIPIKQSHVIKKALETDKYFYEAFVAAQNRSFIKTKSESREHDQHQNFQRSYNRMIYYHWDNRMFVAPKHANESPEFNLVKMITRNSAQTALDALNEQNEFYFKKYDYIRNKQLISKHIFGEPYVIGEINASWN